MRVIVTRPQHEARQWVEQLHQAGFNALAIPLIEVLAAPDPQAVQLVWQGIADFDAVMFVSGNAVDYFFACKPAGGQLFESGTHGPRLWVTGPGSYAALIQRAGVPAQHIDAPSMQAGQFDSEALWQVVSGQVKLGTKVLIVRGAGSENSVQHAQGVGRDWLAQQIVQAGGELDFAVAYQRACPDFDVLHKQIVSSSACDGSVWVFSSSEAIENLKEAFPVQQWQQAKAVVTHTRIGRAASQAGFGLVLESRPVLADVMACLQTLQ
jgi:uroporphyrinogen-III synthase